MRIVSRDDDTCGFTDPKDLQVCYESIWPEFPVSLSVTPFRIPGNDRNFPQHLAGNMNVIPLTDNLKLVTFPQEGVTRGSIDLSLHGYHHLRYNGLPEFVSGNGLKNRAQEGRSYLEDIFGISIRAFVPPNNSIGMEGLGAVIAADMNLVGVPSLWSGRVRKRSIKTIRNMPSFHWHEKIIGKKYPYVLDFGNHTEVTYHTAGPKSDYASLVRELEYCHKHNGVYSTVHPLPCVRTNYP